MQKSCKSVFRLFALAHRIDRYLLTILAADSLCAALVVPVGVAIPAAVLNRLEAGAPSGQILAAVGGYLAVILALKLGQNFARCGVRLRGEWVRRELERKIKLKAAGLDIAIFESPQTQNMLYKANDSVNQTDPFEALKSIFRLAGNAVTVFSLCGILAASRPVLILLPLFSAVLASLGQAVDSRIELKFWENMSPLFRKLNYCDSVLKDPKCAKEVRMYRFSGWFIEKYTHIRREFRRMYRTRYRKMAYIQLGIMAVVGAELFLSYLLLVNPAVAGIISIGTFSTCILAVQQFSSGLSDILAEIPALKENSQYIGAYFEFLSIENKIGRDEA